MKRKTKAVSRFLDELHNSIISNPQFRKDTRTRSEAYIQTELRPLILTYLEQNFKNLGYADPVAKANKSFYWEGQEGIYGKERATTFASRNYPDFLITNPYLLAIEYKQGSNGSLVKQAISQALMHTLSGDFDYAYVLFHDENQDKRIERSITNKTEAHIIQSVWSQFNVYLKFV